MARERWRDVGDSVAYAVCLHWTLYRGRSYHWWSVIKKFTFIYSLLANVFLRTYLQRAIQFPVVPKPIHQNVRHIVMLFFDELPLVNTNYVLQCASTPVFTYGERLLEKARVLSCWGIILTFCDYTAVPAVIKPVTALFIVRFHVRRNP